MKKSRSKIINLLYYIIEYATKYKNLYIYFSMCIKIDKKQLETLNTNKSNVLPYTPKRLPTAVRFDVSLTLRRRLRAQIKTSIKPDTGKNTNKKPNNRK